MNEQKENGFIKQIIKGVNNSKIAVTKKITQYDENILDENIFLDNGFIHSKIERLKSKHKKIIDEINMIQKYEKIDEYNKKKINDFILIEQEIKKEICFLASNDFSNIDSCLDMIKDIEWNFKLCIIALKKYENENSKEAFQLFHTYFKENNNMINHFLVNKVYGKILLYYEQYEPSILFFRKAIEMKPEEVEIHKNLKEIYTKSNMEEEVLIEENILHILEG